MGTSKRPAALCAMRQNKKKIGVKGAEMGLTSSIICSVYSAPSGMYSRATALNMSVLMAPGATPLTVIFLSPQSID